MAKKYNVELTELQLAFIEHYLVDRNGLQAAIRAGYSPTYAGQQAHQLLGEPRIMRAIQARLKKLKRKSDVDVEFITMKGKQILDRCMDAEPVMVFDVNSGEWKESGVFKFDSAGANKALDTLGKIVGAFKEDNEQSNKILIGKDLADEKYTD